MMMLPREPEVCRDFLAGQCQRGTMCKFMHVQTERNRNMNNAQVCRDWLAGKCNRGGACKFVHQRGVFGVPSMPNAFGGYEMAPRKHVCHQFLQNGVCQYGDTCKYMHESKGQMDAKQLLTLLAPFSNKQSFPNLSTNNGALAGLSSNLQPFGSNSGMSNASLLQLAMNNMSNRSASPLETEICRFYAKHGRCKYGNTCKFTHTHNGQFVSTNGLSSLNGFTNGNLSGGIPNQLAIQSLLSQARTNGLNAATLASMFPNLNINPALLQASLANENIDLNSLNGMNGMNGLNGNGTGLNTSSFGSTSSYGGLNGYPVLNGANGLTGLTNDLASLSMSSSINASSLNGSSDSYLNSSAASNNYLFRDPMNKDEYSSSTPTGTSSSFTDASGSNSLNSIFARIPPAPLTFSTGSNDSTSLNSKLNSIFAPPTSSDFNTVLSPSSTFSSQPSLSAGSSFSTSNGNGAPLTNGNGNVNSNTSTNTSSNRSSPTKGLNSVNMPFPCLVCGSAPTVFHNNTMHLCSGCVDRGVVV